MRPFILIGWLLVSIGHTLQADVAFDTESLHISLNSKGWITSIYDKRLGQEYLVASEALPLLSIRVKGVLQRPNSLVLKGSNMQLKYPDQQHTAEIEVVNRTSYLVFTLRNISNQNNVELVIWGPFPTTINETVGECVGVVRNKSFALGIQALNPKTLGGYPSAENDIEPSYNIFASGNPVDLQATEKVEKLYRGQTAKIMPYGSVLQAYTRNRNQSRVIAQWEHDHYTAPAYADGGVQGTSIALFGCAPEQVLKTISAIEIQEGLPHPLLHGEWAKTSREATASYLIANFGERNLDTALALTRKAGLKYLYQGDPFENWGHFDLKKDLFPHNWGSLKHCVERAAIQGIHLGVHTLSNFITTNDAYVTPVPDPRLAKVGTSILVNDLSPEDTEIEIGDPRFFNQMKNNTLQAVMVGNELIRYRAVSTQAPWKLLDCVRGAFKTKPSLHRRGAEVGKLMDHPYKVFLSDASLSAEIARNLASLFNETGLRQTSFDGLEGSWSSGMGQYARILFTKSWYEHLSPALQGQVINDASNPAHFNWHINTRYNWGEPWYAGFRESQLQYRLMNQDFYRRNFLPAMLGWFSLSAKTTLEDVEWLLARAAGFEAGFAFNVSLENVDKNGQQEAIFNAINTWESARMVDAFSELQKQKLMDIHQEFHLEKISPQHWSLIPLVFKTFNHMVHTKQPGEPTGSTYALDQPFPAQPLQFTLQQIISGDHPGGKIDRIILEINQNDPLQIPVNLEKDHRLVLNQSGELHIYSAEGHHLRQIPWSEKISPLPTGENRLHFEAKMVGSESALLKLIVKIVGTPEDVFAK